MRMINFQFEIAYNMVMVEALRYVWYLKLFSQNKGLMYFSVTRFAIYVQETKSCYGHVGAQPIT